MIKKYFLYNRHPFMQVSGVFALFKYYKAWRALQNPKRSALDDQKPWINFEATDYLKTILEPDMKVFEYGTGGSSIFFAKNVLEVVGVEHDDVWFNRVRDCVEKENIGNFSGFLCPPALFRSSKSPNYSDPDSYLSSDAKYLNEYSFFNYASTIDQYQDSYFDIVFVDGRARPSCIKHAVPKVRSGGYLILDNSDRQYYVEQLTKELHNFKKVFERFGPGPYNEGFWGTTFYKKL